MHNLHLSQVLQAHIIICLFLTEISVNLNVLLNVNYYSMYLIQDLRNQRHYFNVWADIVILRLLKIKEVKGYKPYDTHKCIWLVNKTRTKNYDIPLGWRISKYTVGQKMDVSVHILVFSTVRFIFCQFGHNSLVF